MSHEPSQNAARPVEPPVHVVSAYNTDQLDERVAALEETVGKLATILLSGPGLQPGTGRSELERIARE